MKLYVLAASAAALVFTAGAASAATSSGRFAEPKQPIAYAKLDAYLKATPRQRARGDWGLDQTAANNAATGTAANASATAPQNDMTTYSTPPAAAAAPDAGTTAAPPAPDASAPPAPAAPDAAPPAAAPPADNGGATPPAGGPST